MRIILIIISILFITGSIYSQHNDTLKKKRKPLTEVFKEYQDQLLSIPGVQGFYEGASKTGAQCIVVMIDEYTKEIKEALPDSLEGYPVAIEVTGEIKPLKEKKKSPEK